MASGSFFTLQTRSVIIDSENSVVIRKLTHGEKMKVMGKAGAVADDSILRGVATVTATLEMAIVSWSGPGFGDVPVSPEAISSLPVDVSDVIIDEINNFGVLNGSQKKESGGPTS